MNDMQTGRDAERGSDARQRHEWYLGFAAKVVYLLTSIVGLVLACIELWERLH